MKHILQRIMGSIVVIGLLVALINAPASVPVRAQAPTKLKLGYLPVVIYAPIFVGIERSYFAAEGIEIELVPLPSGGGDSIVQLAAGNFDLAVTGAGAALWNVLAQGLEVKIIAPLHTERPPLATPLVISAARVDEIKRVADLKGKKIAVNGVGSAIEYWVYSALKRDGLSIADVELVAMPFPQMAPALEARAIDAAVITDPLATLAKDQGVVAFLADDYIDGITVTYVFAGEKVLTERRDAIEGFMRAYLKAMRDLQGDGWLTEDTAAIIEKYTQVPSAAVLRMNRPYFDPNGVMPLVDLTEVQRYFASRGVLEYQTLLKVEDYVDSSFVAAAVEALGEYRMITPTP